MLGLECAGIVSAVGDETVRFKVGDAVCALLPGGGYAEQVAVDEGSVVPVPAGFDFVQAAALREVYATAWLNLFIERSCSLVSAVLSMLERVGLTVPLFSSAGRSVSRVLSPLVVIKAELLPIAGC